MSPFNRDRLILQHLIYYGLCDGEGNYHSIMAQSGSSTQEAEDTFAVDLPHSPDQRRSSAGRGATTALDDAMNRLEGSAVLSAAIAPKRPERLAPHKDRPAAGRPLMLASEGAEHVQGLRPWTRIRAVAHTCQDLTKHPVLVLSPRMSTNERRTMASRICLTGRVQIRAVRQGHGLQEAARACGGPHGRGQDSVAVRNRS